MTTTKETIKTVRFWACKASDFPVAAQIVSHEQTGDRPLSYVVIRSTKTKKKGVYAFYVRQGPYAFVDCMSHAEEIAAAMNAAELS